MGGCLVGQFPPVQLDVLSLLVSQRLQAFTEAEHGRRNVVEPHVEDADPPDLPLLSLGGTQRGPQRQRVAKPQIDISVSATQALQEPIQPTDALSLLRSAALLG